MTRFRAKSQKLHLRISGRLQVSQLVHKSFYAAPLSLSLRWHREARSRRSSPIKKGPGSQDGYRGAGRVSAPTAAAGTPLWRCPHAAGEIWSCAVLATLRSRPLVACSAAPSRSRPCVGAICYPYPPSRNGVGGAPLLSAAERPRGDANQWRCGAARGVGTAPLTLPLPHVPPFCCCDNHCVMCGHNLSAVL